MTLTRPGGPLVRRQRARHRPPGHRRGPCSAAAVRHPWSTAAVSARIRWQGIRLYLRGLPVVPRPAHQPQEEFSDHQHAASAALRRRRRTVARRRRRRTAPRRVRPWPGPCSPARWRRCRCGCGSRTAVCSARAPRTRRSWSCTGPGAFFRRFGASGLIGFGESYLAGDWDCADLTGLLTVFAAHAADLIPPWLQTDARAGGAPPARRRPADPRRRPPQHPPPLRPVQRAVRAVPRRDHDLLLAPCSLPSRRHPAGRRSPAGRRPAAQDRPPAGPGRGRPGLPGCSRSAPAGASWPSGPRRAAPRGHGHDLARAAARWPRAGSPKPAWPTGSASSCATTATSRARSTPSARAR